MYLTQYIQNFTWEEINVKLLRYFTFCFPTKPLKSVCILHSQRMAVGTY